MAKFQLKNNSEKVDVGTRVKLIAEFEPLADCSEEALWVRVQEVEETDGDIHYTGIVDDYLTYVRSHGITQGFMLRFKPENICEVKKS